jgi:HJR/Mrr/RecB family endonuclease
MADLLPARNLQVNAAQQCFAHAREVRAFPEDPAAAQGRREAHIARTDTIQDSCRDARGISGPQRQVARQAQRKRSRVLGQGVPGRDLAQLLFGLAHVHVVPAQDLAALEQLAVARQHDAALFLSEARAAT